MTFKNISLISAAAALMIVSGSSSAATIGELGVLDSSANGGINPATGVAWANGDQYRLIFITSDTVANSLNNLAPHGAGSSTNAADYNAFITEVAQGDYSTSLVDGNTVDWFVVGSVGATQATATGAKPNTGTDSGTGVPILLFDGTTLFAADNADLWNGPNGTTYITIDEEGTSFTTSGIATGTTNSGAIGSKPIGNTDSGNVVGGRTTTNQWMQVAGTNSASAHYYGISDTLTVVPEPGSLALLGMASLCVLRRRRG